MRALFGLFVLTACGRVAHPAPSLEPAGRRSAASAPATTSIPFAGPHSDLRAFDVEPGDAGPNVRLMIQRWPIAGATCYLAIRTTGGWYISDDPVGPCDPVADLPGSTTIVSRNWRDGGGGTRTLVLELEIRKTTRDLTDESTVVLTRRVIGATVRCTVQPAPPHCAPIVLYPRASYEIDDAPVDSLRTPHREFVRPTLLAR